jgi:acyl-homoserine lactone acylase PvdQ
MGYFLSLIFSLYNANTDINYANYDLNVDNIMMRDMESSIFDIEYDFGDRTIWITNYGYIPTITRFSKSYTKISVEGLQKSFGYNNLSQIPFEEKGMVTKGSKKVYFSARSFPDMPDACLEILGKRYKLLENERSLVLG